MSARRMAGFTLIEVVLAIVVIGMCGATIVGLMTSIDRRSADTLLSERRTNIAAAYLREITSQAWSDPDGGTENRGNYDNIDDYAGLNEAPTDRAGNVLANFNGYNVIVAITQPGLDVIPNAQTRLIRITVTDPFGGTTNVAGFRTQRP
jgi:MSHA pilin protein MshD